MYAAMPAVLKEAVEKSYEALEALGYDVDIKYKKTTHSIDECN